MRIEVPFSLRVRVGEEPKKRRMRDRERDGTKSMEEWDLSAFDSHFPGDGTQMSGIVEAGVLQTKWEVCVNGPQDLIQVANLWKTIQGL